MSCFTSSSMGPSASFSTSPWLLEEMSLFCTSSSGERRAAFSVRRKQIITDVLQNAFHTHRHQHTSFNRFGRAFPHPAHAVWSAGFGPQCSWGCGTCRASRWGWQCCPCWTTAAQPAPRCNGTPAPVSASPDCGKRRKLRLGVHLDRYFSCQHFEVIFWCKGRWLRLLQHELVNNINMILQVSVS